MPNSDDLHLFNVLTKSETLAECARKLDATPPAVTSGCACWKSASASL